MPLTVLRTPGVGRALPAMPDETLARHIQYRRRNLAGVFNGRHGWGTNELPQLLTSRGPVEAYTICAARNNILVCLAMIRMRFPSAKGVSHARGLALVRAKIRLQFSA